MTGPSIERGRRDPESCPGASEYGHGFMLTRVHAGGCCARWEARRLPVVRFGRRPSDGTVRCPACFLPGDVPTSGAVHFCDGCGREPRDWQQDDEGE